MNRKRAYDLRKTVTACLLAAGAALLGFALYGGAADKGIAGWTPVNEALQDTVDRLARPTGQSAGDSAVHDNGMQLSGDEAETGSPAGEPAGQPVAAARTPDSVAARTPDSAEARKSDSAKARTSDSAAARTPDSAAERTEEADANGLSQDEHQIDGEAARSEEASGSRSEAKGSPPSDPENRSKEEGRIDLNRATPAELETLPGIGPSKAKAIADYRDKIGGFRDIAQLLDVKGIGPKVFERVSSQVYVSSAK